MAKLDARVQVRISPDEDHRLAAVEAELPLPQPRSRVLRELLRRGLELVEAEGVAPLVARLARGRDAVCALPPAPITEAPRGASPADNPVSW